MAVPSTTTTTTKAVTQRTITLSPGECVVLPNDAVVKSIVTSGPISVTSSCGALPIPTGYKCGVFYYFTDDEDVEGNDGPMEEGVLRIASVKVGTSIFTVDESAHLGDANDLPPIINQHITDLALFKVMGAVYNSLESRYRWAVYFQVPEAMWSQTTMKLDDRSTYYVLEPVAATCGEYPEPE